MNIRCTCLDPDAYAAPEISGSAFVYALAWGITHGILDSATYYYCVISEGADNRDIWAEILQGELRSVGAG